MIPLACMVMWFRCQPSYADAGRIVLLLDSSSVHKCEEVRRPADTLRIDPACMPAGCADALHPCDSHFCSRIRGDLPPPVSLRGHRPLRQGVVRLHAPCSWGPGRRCRVLPPQGLGAFPVMRAFMAVGLRPFDLISGCHFADCAYGVHIHVRNAMAYDLVGSFRSASRMLVRFPTVAYGRGGV
jgi:hypothetical protein